MKTLILSILLVAFHDLGWGQDLKFTPANSLFRKAMVSFSKGVDGYYYQANEVMMDTLADVSEAYAYDKKNRMLYVLTPYSNCVVALDKQYSKIIKKNKSIPQLKGEELTSAVDLKINSLLAKYQYLNEQRKAFIEDSIAKAKARAKFVADSLAEVKRRIEEARLKREKYRATHNWRNIPTGNKYISCSFCDDLIHEDSVYISGMTEDSICFATFEEGELGLICANVHWGAIPQSLKEYEPFRYHCEVFADSIKSSNWDGQMAAYLNISTLNSYLDKVQKKAPYGYIKEWSWDDDFSISFNLTYVNTNKNTIKYIDTYFKVLNDVGDVRCTGHFKGTGPVEQYSSGTWNWDYSRYYAAGDATKMKLTKIIITYMNGRQKVLSANNIVYD